MQAATPPASAYYVDDFMQVIAGIRARYGFLLNGFEHDYLAKLDALSLPALKLYIRLVNRRGPCFRIGRLDYSEIGPLAPLIAELQAAGLLAPGDAPDDQALCVPILGCFTHVELRASLQADAPKNCPRKDKLLAWLASWPGYASWLDALLVAHPVITLVATDPWPFLRFLFFGALRDNLSDFVTRALGHVVTESIAPDNLTAQFTCRRQADDAYRMACLYVAFRRLRDSQSALDIFSWWQSQNQHRAALMAGTEWFDRLVDRLGRLLERDGQPDAALQLYETSPTAPARERRARLLIKLGRSDEAAILLRAMIDAPCHAEEAYAARHVLARLENRSRSSEARRFQGSSGWLTLDNDDCGVEAAALAHYHALGWQGVHSENWLWNAAFGLLLWEAIYDPAIGVFHSPLQFAPADLHDTGFYGRRRPAIEARLALLENPATALAAVTKTFHAKHGIANPFVAWHETLPDLLAVMLHRLPPRGLAAALRHLAADIKHHSRGLPDLFLWTASDYRFVEIKAKNDHLASHQYEWLRVLAGAGIKVSLENIRIAETRLVA